MLATAAALACLLNAAPILPPVPTKPYFPPREARGGWRALDDEAPRSRRNLAVGKPVTASSIEMPKHPAAQAVDGRQSTRWASAFSDPQWLAVDLGKPHLSMLWENPRAPWSPR